MKITPVGTFTTSSPATIALCERALKAAPHGGYVTYRGNPVKITHVRISRKDGRASALVSYIIATLPRTRIRSSRDVS